MARPKGRRKATAGQEERESIVHMKGSPAYAEWLEALHRKTRIPKVQLVRLALEEWAKRNKHPKPPEI